MIRRAHWMAVTALMALTFATYTPALRNGFIWDDDDHLTANPVMIYSGAKPEAPAKK